MPELSPEERKAYSEQQRKIKRTRALEDANFRTLMGMQLFRSWLWKHLSECGAFRSPFNESANMSYFAGGEQNVGLRIIAELSRVCPELYFLMITENSDARSSPEPNTSPDVGTDPDSGA